METYKNEINWRDLEDNEHPYKQGESYPRDGVEPSPERLAELLSDKNNAKKPVISTVEGDEPSYPNHVGGGTYELSNGEKVKGKKQAVKAEKALTE